MTLARILERIREPEVDAAAQCLSNAPCSLNERMRESRQRSESAMSMLTDKVRYELFRLLEPNPELSQRDVARALGISLGKVNYCVRALMAKGWIKAANFKHSTRKAGYMYLLTPRGVEEKARLTAQFLQTRIQEYEALNREIEQIREEIRSQAGRVPERSSHQKS